MGTSEVAGHTGEESGVVLGYPAHPASVTLQNAGGVASLRGRQLSFIMAPLSKPALTLIKTKYYCKA